ncbi:hypothetical protein RRG08_055077 [Elysia crispata]|uniref:Uncharacterized protein n=1 Tax=Elysia crispata TaxID=231223 RepID=A0AAE1B1B5_9GAST|nr:hypothetical protein RRG08_055077 [Elysia crispata]
MAQSVETESNRVRIIMKSSGTDHNILPSPQELCMDGTDEKRIARCLNKQSLNAYDSPTAAGIITHGQNCSQSTGLCPGVRV